MCVCWKRLFASTTVKIQFLNYSALCKAVCMSVVLWNWFCPLAQFFQTVSTHILIMVYKLLIQVVTGRAFCKCSSVLENIWRTFFLWKVTHLHASSFCLLEIPLAKCRSQCSYCYTVLCCPPKCPPKRGEKKPSVSQCTAQEIIRWKKPLNPLSELV